jgi:hypothetical protein
MSSSSSGTNNNTQNKTMDNLWLNLLKQATTKTIVSESACIILGDKDSGSSQLMASLTYSETSDPAIHFVEMASYSTLEVDESSTELSTKVHFWSLDERMLKSAIDLVKIRNLDNRVSYI